MVLKQIIHTIGRSLWGLLVLTVAVACANEADFAGNVGQPPQGADVTLEEPEEPAEPQPPSEPIDIRDPGMDPEPASPVQTTYTFPAATIVEEDVSWAADLEWQSQTVILREAPPTVTTWQQVERPWVENNVIQGEAGRSYQDEFAVSAAAPLDILVVMDDSTSMAAEAVNLASKLDSLLTSVTNTDWRIAVVTSSDPCLRGGQVIESSDVDAPAKFSAAVQVPLDDTVVEKGFPMAVKALAGECNGVTTPWLRENSAIAVLVVSDEDNCGSHAGEGCAGETGETAAQMTSYLEALRPDGNARIYGLVELGNECGTGAFRGTIYLDAIRATQGHAGSICAANYSTTLETMSENISRIVRYDFPLSATPDPDEPGSTNLTVTIDGVEVPAGHRQLVGAVLSLTQVDAESLRLVATYWSGATPRYDRWQLNEEPAAGTVVAEVDGQLETAISIDPEDSRTVVFDQGAPADGAAIRLSFRKNTELLREFPFANADDVWQEPLTMKKGSEDLLAYEIDPTEGVLTLATAPADGEILTMTYRTRAGLVTEYDLLPNFAEAHEILVHDQVSGAPVEHAFAAGQFSLAADEIVAGRAVEVSYNFGYAAATRTIPMPADIIGSTIELTQSQASDPACELADEQGPVGDDYTGGTVVEVLCPAVEVGDVTIQFQRISSWHTEFTLPVRPMADDDIAVFVDDAAVEFTLSDQTVVLNESSLSPGSTIAVQVTVR